MIDPGAEGASHFVVVGDNQLAFRLTRALSTRFDGTVSVLVRDPGSRYAGEMGALPGVELIEAYRTDVHALTKAHAGQATGIALLDQDDGGNVATALLIGEEWPDLRVVVRIFDEALGKHIADGTRKVLSSSKIAAPEMVASALDLMVRLPVPGYTFVAVTDRDYEKFGLQDGMVLFATDAADEVVPLPAPDREGLEPRVYVAPAQPGQTLPHVDDDLSPDEDELAPRPRGHALVFLRTLLATSGWNLALAAGVLLGIVLFGALAIWLTTSTSYFDAVYEAVLPALGGSDPEEAAHPVVKVTQVVLTIVSVAVIPWVTGVVVAGVLRTVEALRKGAPRKRMSNHVVVVGLGDLGIRIVRSLDVRGIPVVAVDIDESARGVAIARDRHVPVVIGDASRVSTLRRAYVDSAQAVVVVTSGSATTLGIGFAAPNVVRDPDSPEHLRVVLRVFDRDVARQLRQVIHDARGLSASFLAAPRFAAELIGEEVRAAVPYRNRVALLTEIPVARNSQLVDQLPSQLAADGLYQLLAIQAATLDGGGGGQVFRPVFGRRISPGDILYVVATTKGLRTLRELAQPTHAD